MDRLHRHCLIMHQPPFGALLRVIPEHWPRPALHRLAPALRDKHEPARRDVRLLQLLVAPGNAAVTDVLDAIPLSVLAALSLGRGNA
jgi:hypothetical protein